jgi:hypothetical protein
MPDKLDLATLRDMFLRTKSIKPGSNEDVANRFLNPEKTNDGGMPEVGPPAIFKPEPPVIGSPELARTLHEVYRMVPELRRSKVSKISTGPTRGMMDAFEDSKFGINDFDKTNLMGTYSLVDNSVFVRPRHHIGEQLNTLAHELTHGMDHREPVAEQVGNAAQDSLTSEMIKRILRQK